MILLVILGYFVVAIGSNQLVRFAFRARTPATTSAPPTATHGVTATTTPHHTVPWPKRLGANALMLLGGPVVWFDCHVHDGKIEGHHLDWADTLFQAALFWLVITTTVTIGVFGAVEFHAHEVKRVSQNLQIDRELGTNPSAAWWKLEGKENGVVVETSNHVKFRTWTTQEMEFSHPILVGSGERKYRLLASQAYGRWTSPDGTSGWFKLLHGYPQFGDVTTIAMDFCNGNDGDVTEGVRRITLTLNR